MIMPFQPTLSNPNFVVYYPFDKVMDKSRNGNNGILMGNFFRFELLAYVDQEFSVMILLADEPHSILCDLEQQPNGSKHKMSNGKLMWY